MLTRQQLKENAKARLKGNWGLMAGIIIVASIIQVFASYLAMFVFMMGSSFVNLTQILREPYIYTQNDYQLIPVYVLVWIFFLILIVTAIFMLITGPISCGILRGFYRLARGFKPTFNDLFYFLNGGRYKGIVKLCFNLYLRYIGWVIAAAAILCTSIVIGTIKEYEALILIGLLIYLAIIIVMYYVIGRYAIAFVQFNDYEGIDAKEAIQRSIDATKPYLGQIFMMGLSFTGWILAAIACVALPMLLSLTVPLIGGILLIFGYIGYYFLLYRTYIYMIASIMEQDCAISDEVYGNPYANMIFDQWGNAYYSDKFDQYGNHMPIQPIMYRPPGFGVNPTMQQWQPPMGQNFVPQNQQIVEPMVAPVAPYSIINSQPSPDVVFEEEEKSINDSQVDETPKQRLTEDDSNLSYEN